MLYFLIRMIVTKKKLTRKFDDMKEYKCTICGANFQHLVNFKIHQQNHIDNDQHMCCKFFGYK